MTGWKSKVGGVLVALGGLVGTMSTAFPEYQTVFVSGGVFLGALGTAFLGIGIAHKIEKAAPGK